MKSNVVKNGIVFAMFVIGILYVLIYFFVPKLNIEKNKITINVNEDYQNINYSASVIGKDVTDKVKVDGVVDTSHVGTYRITYELKESIFDIKKVVEVKVVDNVPPELKLYGQEEYKVCSVDSFEDEGYSAVDNYDGDLTDKVEVKKYDSSIDYIVKDSSNNETKKTRNIIIDDEVAPSIKLKGNEKVYVTLNSEYKEEGATASDNCDGDITNNIQIEGSIDVNNEGTYTLTYIVKDSKGNESSVKREVVVQKEQVVADKNNKNTNGVIYLTFDDGPGGYTNTILDVLKKYDVKATFFVTLAGSDDVIKREYDEGHTVALHTATHKYEIYTSVDTYFADLNKVAKRVKDITGIDSKYVRFPGGSSNTISRRYSSGIMTKLAKEVQERGYKYYDWNVDVNDAGKCAYVSNRQYCVLSNFKSGIYPNRSNVVLMHDIKSYTASALEDMIKYGKSKGFTFKAIDDNTPTCHHGIHN